jgi:hypothetical protein
MECLGELQLKLVEGLSKAEAEKIGAKGIRWAIFGTIVGIAGILIGVIYAAS